MERIKRYQFRRLSDGVEAVVIEGLSSRPLDLRLDLHNHSPTGFEWGYGGSGPAQLALAVLADCLGDEYALDFYQDFKRDVVAGQSGAAWSIEESAIRAWAHFTDD